MLERLRSRARTSAPHLNPAEQVPRLTVLGMGRRPRCKFVGSLLRPAGAVEQTRPTDGDVPFTRQNGATRTGVDPFSRAGHKPGSDE